MKAENCAVTTDIPTSDDGQKANANPPKPPTYRTAQAYTTDRPKPPATAHLNITAGLHMKGLDDVTVYFADSYCSWQKGAVENVNKLIRQYIPQKVKFQ
jgi:IS30 family transposase